MQLIELQYYVLHQAELLCTLILYFLIKTRLESLIWTTQFCKTASQCATIDFTDVNMTHMKDLIKHL